MKRMKLIAVLFIVTFGLTFCQDDTFNKVVHFNQGFTVGNNTSPQLQPYLGGISGDITWADINDKPDNYPPAAHTHPLTDITGQPGKVQLKKALEEMGIYFSKTTTELNAITPPDGFGIALDRTTGYYKVYSGGQWKVIITDR